jgi:dihydrodipicolinate reductase
MHVVIIDGHGGRMGKMIIELLKKTNPELELTAVGTNSIATATMVKAGADVGATGENPVVVACRTADIIVGPIGIVIADSLQGEVTPAMAVAIGQSQAQKILIPVNRCNHHIVGMGDLTMSEYIRQAAEDINRMICGE